MKIINTSIWVIDYTTENILKRETPESFDQYVSDLIQHINTNENVRKFKTRSDRTQVINCILSILSSIDNNQIVLDMTNDIANRLLRTEVSAQEKIRGLRVNVKKGSLIQALLYDDTREQYSYLLAKVEHSDFIDDADFSFKTGFSKDKKTIWKSCLFDLSEPESSVFDAKIYSDTKAKFWHDGFLELDEVNDDEANTIGAFKAIEETLNRSIKKYSLEDYTYIRNGFVAYLRGHDFVDYNNMIDEVVGEYQPASVDREKLNDFKNKLRELPANKGFDYQFSPVPKAINARIRQVYKVNTGIELKITSDIPDIKNTITAYEDENGIRYVKIRTNDNTTFDSFKNTI